MRQLVFVQASSVFLGRNGDRIIVNICYHKNVYLNVGVRLTRLRSIGSNIPLRPGRHKCVASSAYFGMKVQHLNKWKDIRKKENQILRIRRFELLSTVIAVLRHLYYAGPAQIERVRPPVDNSQMLSVSSKVAVIFKQLSQITFVGRHFRSEIFFFSQRLIQVHRVCSAIKPDERHA